MVKCVTKKVSTLLDSIGALKVLRVLKLSQIKVSALPKSIHALTILRTLDLPQIEISILLLLLILPLLFYEWFFQY